MTQFLPPNLLALFAPRDPIPFLPQLEKLPHEKHHNQPYCGIAPYIRHFEDPRDAPPPTKAATREERLERKRREKAERRQTVLETELQIWDPHNDPNAQGDAFRTLFVARVNYDTTESKLRREFEVYGPVKRIYLVYNKQTSKPRGYAFIEYEHERDMHSAYKHADGKKIDGRRVLVDVERGRTVKGWQPRRLGGGLGGTRRGGPDVNIKHSGRDDASRYDERPIGGGERERDRGGERRADRSREKDREKDRGERRRSRSRERRRRTSPSRERADRGVERGAERGGDRGAERGGDRGAERGGDRGAERGGDRGGPPGVGGPDEGRRRERERERGGGGGSGEASRSRERSRDRDRKRRSRSRDRKRERERGKAAGSEEGGEGATGSGNGDGGERAPDDPGDPGRDEGNAEGEERGRDRDRGDRDRDRDRRRSHRDKDRERDRERRRDRDREHKRDRGDRERGGDRRGEERQASQGPEALGNGEDGPGPEEEGEEDGQNGAPQQEAEWNREEGYTANENGHMMEPQADEEY